MYSVTERREVWKKVGEEDVKMYEYSNAFITADVCLLWNTGGLLKKKAFDIISELMESDRRESEQKQKEEKIQSNLQTGRKE